MRNASGIEDSRISSRAGAAAWAKNASEAADQAEVARVLNPIGPKTRVAGSSFITSRNTRAAADAIPGLAKGNVTEVMTCQGGRPKLRAASSNRGLICKNEVRRAPTAGETNSTT